MHKKVVLVTGASEGGIGYAVSKEFDRQGCVVYASARRLEALASLPPSVHRLELDVLRLDSCQAAVERVLAEQGRIDILINNAGAGGTGALLDANAELDGAAHNTFEVNFWAPLRLSKLIVPHMAKQRSGLIINVGSIVGNVTTPWIGIYSASKAALHSATETLRMEVQGFGIQVMLLAPGAITSQFGRKQLETFKLPDDSLYKSVVDKIEERANMSQEPHHSLPASKLAERVVARALRPQPPTFFTTGGKAFLFFIFERLPRKLIWWLLSRRMGANLVGQPRAQPKDKQT
ncbi:hypothetical protein JCM10207_007453 [Rhodosporidiobolus poonsookiae]